MWTFGRPSCEGDQAAIILDFTMGKVNRRQARITLPEPPSGLARRKAKARIPEFESAALSLNSSDEVIQAHGSESNGLNLALNQYVSYPPLSWILRVFLHIVSSTSARMETASKRWLTSFDEI
jgi:hypothetical protein